MKITPKDLVKVPVERLVRGEQYFVSDKNTRDAVLRGVATYGANSRSKNNIHWQHWYELRQPKPNLDGLEIDFREWDIFDRDGTNHTMSINGSPYTLRRRINPELERLKAERAELDRKIKELEGGDK